MSGPFKRRTLALVILLTLVALALLATSAAARESYYNWRVMDDETRSGETIFISGRLTVDLGATLHFKDCTLIFDGGEAGDVRVSVRSGELVLEDTDLISQVPSLITVDDTLVVLGDVQVSYMDIHVDSLGRLRFKDADASLVGSYTPPSDFTPLKLTVDGTLSAVDSRVSLHHAIIRSRGTVTLQGSELDATMDYGTDHPFSNRRVLVERGLLSLTDSLLWDIWGGVECWATLSAKDTVFASADLILEAFTSLESL